jgi:pyridoxine kinase
MTIKNEVDAFTAMDALHSKGINTIVIKSLDFESDKITILASTNGMLHTLLFCSHIKENNKKTRYRTSVPKFPRYFTGTGDLFAALFLAWTAKGDTVKVSLEKTVNSLYSGNINTLQISYDCLISIDKYR